ncbi:MAG: hypothetical protein KAJ12_05380, partial [Bacteroidetes bacterium]|nr:hypothetical protein [Bacteroidota bacterium]
MPEDKNRKSLLARLRGVQVSRELLIEVSIGLILVLSVTLLFPRGEALEFEYRVGAVWAQKDLIAPFSFSISRDEEEYASDVEDAVQLAYPVFERDTLVVRKQVVLLGEFMELLRGRAAERLQETADNRMDTVGVWPVEAPVESAFSEAEWELISEMSASGMLEVAGQLLEFLIADILRVGVLDQSKDTLTRSEVAIRIGTVETIVPADRLYDHVEAVAALKRQLYEHYGAESQAATIAHRIGANYIVPNLFFNPAPTDQAIALAVDGVPRTLGFVQENERIVSKHERISAETKLKLDSFIQARADRGQSSDVPSQIAGTFIHVALVLALFGIYLHLFRKGIVGSPRKLALISMLIVMVSVGAYVTREVDVDRPI